MDTTPVLDPVLGGTVVAVAADRGHNFSKRPQRGIVLVEGHGVEGDAHFGAYIRHRYLARHHPRLPNLRQVHLIAAELFDVLQTCGYELHPGDLGENITTAGLELERLPLGSRLRLGSTAIVELTGLRTPCALINRFSAGLKRHLVNNKNGPPYRCGVLSVVCSGGSVSAGDPIHAYLPPQPSAALPAL